MKKKPLISLAILIMALVLIYQCFVFFWPRKTEAEKNVEIKIEELRDSIKVLEEERDQLLIKASLDSEKRDSLKETVIVIEKEKAIALDWVNELSVDSGIIFLNNWLKDYEKN